MRRALWLALIELQEGDERLRAFGLDRLAARADDQLQRLEPHRLRAAREAMST